MMIHMNAGSFSYRGHHKQCYCRDYFSCLIDRKVGKRTPELLICSYNYAVCQLFSHEGHLYLLLVCKMACYSHVLLRHLPPTS